MKTTARQYQVLILGKVGEIEQPNTKNAFCVCWDKTPDFPLPEIPLAEGVVKEKLCIAWIEDGQWSWLNPEPLLKSAISNAVNDYEIGVWYWAEAKIATTIGVNWFIDSDL